MSTKWPRSPAGQAATTVLVVGAVCLLGFGILVASGQRGGAGYCSNPVLSIPFTVGIALIVGAGVLGAIARIKGDTSQWLWLIMAVSGVMGIFVVLEVTHI